MYTIRMGTDLAEAQISDLSGAEAEALLDVYDVLRLAPHDGARHTPGGNMYTWDHAGITVVYFILDEQREVAVVRVTRWPS